MIRSLFAGLFLLSLSCAANAQAPGAPMVPNGGAPTGAAGGGLTGTYPNPTVTSVPVSALPVQPNFKVHLAANQSITAGATTKIAFDTVDFDTASAWSAANHNYVPTTAGTYQFCVSVFSGGTFATANIVEAMIAKNGLATTGTQMAGFETMAGGAITLIGGTSGCVIVPMNGTTDTIEADYFSQATTPIIQGNAINLTYFTGYRIGP